MPVVDFESAWYALKAHIATKRSHGAGELAEVMAGIEVGHRIPEMHQGYDDRPVHRHNVPPAGDDAADGRVIAMAPTHVEGARDGDRDVRRAAGGSGRD